MLRVSTQGPGSGGDMEGGDTFVFTLSETLIIHIVLVLVVRPFEMLTVTPVLLLGSLQSFLSTTAAAEVLEVLPSHPPPITPVWTHRASPLQRDVLPQQEVQLVYKSHFVSGPVSVCPPVLTLASRPLTGTSRPNPSRSGHQSG